MLVLILVLQPRHDGWIGQRRGVAERLAFGDVAQQAPHDLAGSRLRQIRGKDDVVGPGDGADLLHDVLLELVDQRLATPAVPSFSVTNAATAWPLISCGRPTTAASATLGMIDERALDFHRADAMPRDVEHVVHAAEQPEEAVGVALGAVAGEVDVRSPTGSRYCFT